MPLIATRECMERACDGKLKIMKDCDGNRYISHCSLELDFTDNKSFVKASICDRDGVALFRGSIDDVSVNHVSLPNVAIRLELEDSFSFMRE